MQQCQIAILYYDIKDLFELSTLDKLDACPKICVQFFRIRLCKYTFFRNVMTIFRQRQQQRRRQQQRQQQLQLHQWMNMIFAKNQA